MDVENSFIRPILTFYYGKGMSEFEAYEEVSKKYGPRAISLKTIRKWYEAFKPKDASPEKKRIYIQMQKFTDDFLINLVNENPDLNMKELAKLADCSDSVISRRIRNINKDGIRVDYRKKGYQNNGQLPFKLKKPLFTDEYLIDLINENPDLSMNGLAKLANCARSTILNRLNQINSNGERVNYVKKALKSCIPKFTDGYPIDLISKNPELSTVELTRLAECSSSAIYKSTNQINSSSKMTNYVKKGSHIGVQKFTDEFLINLVNKNPTLNMKELATLAGCSSSAISKRIKKINSNGEKIKYTSKTNKKKAIFTDQQLINLISDNSNTDITELVRLTDCLNPTISKRLNQVNNDMADDCKLKLRINSTKVNRKKSKFTDEFLINLVNDNPSLNMQELASLAGTSRCTISRRIKQINSRGQKINHIKKNQQATLFKAL